MRIAMITQSYPPMISGAAIFVHRLSETLANKGHSLLVLTASETSKPNLINKPNLKVLKIKSIHNPFRVNQRFTLWPYREMMDELYAFGPDVIHIHDPLQMGMISRKFSREAGTPVVLTVHALPQFLASYLDLPRFVKAGVENLLWKYAAGQYTHLDGIVVSTGMVANIIRQMLGVGPTVISCGIDLQKFFPAKIPKYKEKALRIKFGIPFPVPVLLHVGRLDKDKNVTLTLQGCLPALRNTNAHLLIVGNGTEMNRLKKLALKHRMREKVHFTGYVTDEKELADIYRLASIFVTASEIETQGIVLLEAAACGLPIVAPDCLGIPDLVQDRVNGFLFKPGDAMKFSEYVLQLCKDSRLAKTMGNSNEEIIKEHSFEKTVSNYESLYENCLGSTKFN